MAQSRAGGLQAPTAHLPSQSSWRRQDGPQAPATLDEVLVCQTPRDPTGHAGQSWDTDCRSGWGHIPHAAPAATPRSNIVPVSEGPTGTPGLDSQTWPDGPQAMRDSRHGGSRRTSPGETRLGTGMGGEVRAQSRRLPSRTFLSRCDRSDPCTHEPTRPIRLRGRQRKMLRPDRSPSPGHHTPHLPGLETDDDRLAQGRRDGRRRTLSHGNRCPARGSAVTSPHACGPTRAGNGHYHGLSSLQRWSPMATQTRPVRR